MCLTDARNGYLHDAYLYSGKGSDERTLTPDEQKVSIPTQAVLRLTAQLQKSNRNVTTDKWLGSIELVKELQDRGLTYVGTLKKNKREILKEFLSHKTRAVDSNIFGFANNVTMVSHVPRKNRAVVLVSSMHHSKTFDDVSGKPEIIAYYNMTKGSVDSLDEKCAQYSCGRRTRRWSMTIFFQNS
ncbi:hypothetical protein ANN_03467 [Periplaneta americana]|uniref:PiggyBac transposable element-derived protein domain-containing protein n=1 Tax=Periplaneta americana TaxID=6978 RepID=A0ABQ8U228_PERAM|nr:hypothetical protein ANN_03467 [Periplaneta americana]